MLVEEDIIKHMTKYLKHLNLAVTTYSSGRTDFVSVTAAPGEIRLYDDIINEDNTNVNYNAHIWDDYIKNNYWTVLELAPVIGPTSWLDFTTSYAPIHSVGNSTWIAQWPITIHGPLTSFTFTRLSEPDNTYHYDYFLNVGQYLFDVISTADPVSGNSSITIKLTSNIFSTPIWATENCQAVINGVTYNAVLTVEYSPLGS